MRFAIFAAILLADASLIAEDFTLSTVDGLKRPLSGVQVEVYCDGPKQETLQLNLVSDRDGMARGSYDASRCKPISVSVEKTGYQSYSTGFHSEYVLQIQI